MLYESYAFEGQRRIAAYSFQRCYQFKQVISGGGLLALEVEAELGCVVQTCGVETINKG